jgi:hypothetical protein
MVARPSVIFGDGTKNFLDDDLLTDTLRSNRKVNNTVLRTARQKFFRPTTLAMYSQVLVFFFVMTCARRLLRTGDTDSDVHACPHAARRRKINLWNLYTRNREGFSLPSIV